MSLELLKAESPAHQSCLSRRRGTPRARPDWSHKWELQALRPLARLRVIAEHRSQGAFPGDGRGEPNAAASGGVGDDWDTVGKGVAPTRLASATFVAVALATVSGPLRARPAAKLPSAIATPTVPATTNTDILRTTTLPD
jgi:hypothetical protein